MYPTSIPVQVHSTAALQFIANPFHSMSISEAGGISSTVVAIQQHPNVPKIHEHGWGVVGSILNKSSIACRNEQGFVRALRTETEREWLETCQRTVRMVKSGEGRRVAD